MGLKGIEPLSLAIIGGILLFTFITLPLIIFFTFRIHAIAVVELTYEKSKADLTLLAFLASNEKIGKKEVNVYSLLAERKILNYYGITEDELKEILLKRMKLSANSNFSLAGENEEIIKFGKIERFESSNSFIALPYNKNKLIERIVLVVEK